MFYLVRAVALGEGREAYDKSTQRLFDLPEKEVAQNLGLDHLVFGAIRAEEHAFKYHGNDGVAEWRGRNPQLATLIDAL